MIRTRRTSWAAYVPARCSPRAEQPSTTFLRPTDELIGGLHLLTDGEWFWHTDLAHYVERYHVPVDDRFVEHARLRGWSPPQLSEAELIQLADAFLADLGEPGVEE